MPKTRVIILSRKLEKHFNVWVNKYPVRPGFLAKQPYDRNINVAVEPDGRK